MSNIKITIEGVEKEYEPTNYSQCKEKSALIKGKWYREVEPVKQGYEIMSFRNSSNSIYSLKKDGNYHIEHIAALHLSCCLINVKNGFMSIESIRRLTDGEVFTVGDAVKHIKRDDTWKVEKIEIDGCVIRISAGYYYMVLEYAEKVKQPAILLKTEDGVSITDGEKVIYWCNEDLDKYDSWAKDLGGDSPMHKYFSTEAARDEYIMYNKPINTTLKEYLESHGRVHDFFKSKQK